MVKAVWMLRFMQNIGMLPPKWQRELFVRMMVLGYPDVARALLFSRARGRRR